MKPFDEDDLLLHCVTRGGTFSSLMASMTKILGDLSESLGPVE
jgi:hypothetical protein